LHPSEAVRGIVFFDIAIFNGAVVDDDALPFVALYFDTCGASANLC
jgi:hypothetical protein